MKKDKRKNYYMVLDVETANGLDDPLVYDCGFAIVDKKGNVYEKHSYIIYDIFVLEKELMQTAYYAEKIPMYEQGLKDGTRKMIQFSTLRKFIHKAAKQWGIKAIIAHNMRFDYNALATTQRYLTKSKYRFFLPYGIPVWCTMTMARDTIGKQVSYKWFCERNGYMTKTNQVRLTAEILYRYISGNNDFIEEHTGLADVLIEKEIFALCLRQKKKMRKSPYKERVA